MSKGREGDACAPITAAVDPPEMFGPKLCGRVDVPRVMLVPPEAGEYTGPEGPLKAPGSGPIGGPEGPAPDITVLRPPIGSVLRVRGEVPGEADTTPDR